MMNKIILNTSVEYVSMPINYLYDKRLSMAHKGLMAILWGLSQEPKTLSKINDIQKICSDSVSDTTRLITELKEFGYIKIIDGDFILEITPSLQKDGTETQETALKATQNKKRNNDKGDESKAVIDEIYKMYPSKCPLRNTSTGKSSKDKVKIARLLKTHSADEIKTVIKYVLDNNLGKNYLKNFSTFLNNFPDINELGIKIEEEDNTENEGNLVIDGIEYK